MRQNNYNIIQQDDSLAVKKDSLQKNNHKKHNKKDSALKTNKDTTQTHSDSLIKKDTSFEKNEQWVIDSIRTGANDALGIIQQNSKYTKHLDLIPLKTRYFFSDSPNYKAIEINSITNQKYTNIKVENIYLPGKKYLRTTTDWMVIVGIVSLIVLGWVYGFFKKYLAQLFQSAYDDKISHKLMEERSSITERVSFALNILFVLNTGLFIYEIMLIFKIVIPGISGFPLFAILSGIIAIIYLFKFVFYSFIGFILNSSREISEITHTVFLYSKIYGIFLIPIIVFIPFLDDPQAKYLAYLGMALFAISFLFRIFREFQISTKINFSISYLILYLCAFEILPLLIIGKFFYKLINS